MEREIDPVPLAVPMSAASNLMQLVVIACLLVWCCNAGDPAGRRGTAPQAQRSGEGQGAALFVPRGMPGTGRGKRRVPTFAVPERPATGPGQQHLLETGPTRAERSCAKIGAPNRPRLKCRSLT